MACYHQMGDKSTNLLFEEELKGYAGAILSPVNESEDSMTKLLAKVHAKLPSMDVLFDPQLYYPEADRAKLKSWSHFPKDVDTADLSSQKWWAETNRLLGEVVNRLKPNGVCSPAIVPKVFTNDFYSLMVQVGNELRARVGKMPILQTVIVSLNDMTASSRADEVASIVSRSKTKRLFLVIVTDIDPRNELKDAEGLKGVMRLIHRLENNGQQVLVGFSSTDMVLWKAAGATACATGKHFNLRRFTSSRFDPPSGGGGQLGYMCEEGLLAMLRASDIARINELGMLSKATLENPFTHEILETVSKGEAIVALGWRHYLWWFLNFERQASPAMVRKVLKAADGNWKALDEADHYMEERGNDGSWVRHWLRAESDFRKSVAFAS